MKNKTKLITIIGAMSALSVILAFFIHLPIIPSVAFLEYDPADILIYLMTFVLGIPAGLIMTVIVAVLQGITVSAGSGIIGILMHIAATGTYVLIAGLISKSKKMKKPLSLTLSTLFGIIGTTLIMTAWNLLVTPYYMGVSVKEVIAIIDLIILFNIIKASINGIIAAILATPYEKIIKK